VTQEVILHLAQYGLGIVALNVLLNQVGLPVPVIPTLVLAGALGANGQLPLAAIFLAAVLACLEADCGWYWVGQKYGIRVLKTLCRISLEPDSCVAETQGQFDRWGVNSLVIAKFVPGLSASRSAWPLPAAVQWSRAPGQISRSPGS